jgi:predicted AAA+ superfamily ATPase
MPHERIRHAIPQIQRLASLWPTVGILGPRQVGKSTLVRNQLGISRYFTLDDEDVLSDIEASAKVFVSRLEPPTLIDEVQKAPKLFDALKSRIDKKRIPGQFYLTGSTGFSAKLGIRESLTGRIGLLRLYPLTLAEQHQKNLRPFNASPFGKEILPPRFDIQTYSEAIPRGGMPLPCFIRDEAARSLYWDSWLDTTIHRDLARFFTRGFDPRIPFRILKRLAEAASQGELFEPISTLKEFSRRKIQNYLLAMEETFILRRISIDPRGVGKDHWMLFDSGLLYHLLKGKHSEGATLSLARTFLLNELLANSEYAGKRIDLAYFKSARGSPVDWIWDDIPVKLITQSSTQNLGWQERAVAGAMKTLGAKQGILLAPIERPIVEKKGISILPWSIWS